MAKIKTLRNDEVHKIHVFHCPGCDSNHALNQTWTFNGDYEKPTFSPSVLAYNPRCHSFIREGKIQFLDDCEHELANQTVDLPDYFDKEE